MRIILLFILFQAVGCSFFHEEKPMNEVIVNDENNKPSGEEIKNIDRKTEDSQNKDESGGGLFSTISSILPSANVLDLKNQDDDSKLQISRLIARVEQLNSSVIRMQSRLVVLEKSIHLGITPESLSKNFINQEARVFDDSKKEVPLDANLNLSDNVTTKSTKFDQFQKDLDRAKSLFNKGEYGNAYISFNNISASYTDGVKQGLPTYWIARSWYRLREFQAAKNNFQTFIRKYPTSLKAPMAKFYLAKIEVALGLPGTAISLLQEVIREYPNGNAAAASRKLIAKMNNTL